MRSITGRELARLLETHGWALLRIHGSHHVYGKPGSVVRISVPVHGSRPIKIGLLKHLVKLAGIPETSL